MTVKKIILPFLALIALTLLSACTPKIKKPEWKFARESIRIHIRADQQLNLYNQKSHTLYVCFYQLSALNTFDQLTQNDNGIRKLLEGNLFDSSVAAVNSKTINSGESITVILDRAERAKYVAVVTGYYTQLRDERMVRRHKIMVMKNRESFFKQTYSCQPCPLDVLLVLGPTQIEYSKLMINNEKCQNECEE